MNSSTGLEPLSSDVKRARGDQGEAPAAAASLHALGAGLYRELSGPAGNLALSPYSVGVALALTLNGAKGETLDQMLAVLDADDVDDLNDGLERPDRAHRGDRRLLRRGWRREGRDRARRRQHPVRREERRLGTGLPGHARGQLRRRAASSSTSSTRAARATDGHQRLGGRADPRQDPGDHPAGPPRRDDPAGAGQHAVSQGAVGDAVPEEPDRRRPVPARHGRVGAGASDGLGGSGTANGLGRGDGWQSTRLLLRRRTAGDDDRAARRGSARRRRGADRRGWPAADPRRRWSRRPWPSRSRAGPSASTPRWCRRCRRSGW